MAPSSTLLRPLKRVRARAWRTVVVLLCAAGSVQIAAAANADTTDRSPFQDHGAWAGYSLERSESRSQAAPGARMGFAPKGSVAGIDVSGHQGAVNWHDASRAGYRFAYVKATEGTGYRNPHFRQQFDGSAELGMTHGAYHFALPDRSSGAAQAHFFVDNGGDWESDHRTMPGALDIEHNPYGETCYGLNPRQMSVWLADFSDTYRDRTGRFPAIYTTTNWWNRCTGSNPHFAPNNPLWIARYNTHIGALPAGWHFQSIWQYSDQGRVPGGQDTFNGNEAQLAQFSG